MKCIKCGSEMKKGFLETNGNKMIWDAKKHVFSMVPSEDGVDVGLGFNGCRFEAYCCKECKFISFSFK